MSTNARVMMTQDELLKLMKEVALETRQELQKELGLTTTELYHKLAEKSTTKAKVEVKPTYDVKIKDNHMVIDIDLSGNSGQKSASLKSDVLCHIGSGMRPMPYKLGSNGELVILDSSPSSWREAFGSILIYASRLDR